MPVFAVSFDDFFRVLFAPSVREACLRAARLRNLEEEGAYVSAGDLFSVVDLTQHTSSEVFVSKDLLMEWLREES